MKKKEAKRLREIANVLDDHSCDIKDHTSKQAHWFHWAAQEIRKVLFYSGFSAFKEEKP